MADEPFRKWPSEESSVRSPALLWGMLGSFVDRVCGYRLNLRSVIHLGKRLLGLLKESKDSSSTEYALIFVIVHIQDLLEGQNIDTAMELLQSS